jgi:hypothetical protein
MILFLVMQLYQLSFVQFNAVLLLRSDLALVNVSTIPSLSKPPEFGF